MNEMLNFHYCLLHRGNLYFEYETLKRSGVLWPCLDPMYKYCFYISASYLLPIPIKFAVAYTSPLQNCRIYTGPGLKYFAHCSLLFLVKLKQVSGTVKSFPIWV